MKGERVAACVTNGQDSPTLTRRNEVPLFMLLNEFLSKIERIETGRDTLTVGIDGTSASGKSTLADKFKELDDRITIVHMDDFYHPSEEQKNINPEAIGAGFDWERLCTQVLSPLSHNSFGRYQRYDWDTNKMAEWHDVPTRGIVIIEGCYSIRNELRDFYDVRIWIENPKSVSHERIIQRERDGAGSSYLWETVYRPAEEKYLDVQRPWEHADIVIDGSGHTSDISMHEVNVVYESDRWLNL